MQNVGMGPKFLDEEKTCQDMKNIIPSRCRQKKKCIISNSRQKISTEFKDIWKEDNKMDKKTDRQIDRWTVEQQD